MLFVSLYRSAFMIFLMFWMHVVTSEGKKAIINLTIHFKGDDVSLQGELQLRRAQRKLHKYGSRSLNLSMSH